MYSFILLMLLFQGHSVIAKDECQPVTWNKNSNKIRAATSLAPTSTPSVVSNVSEITILDVSPGEINCRSWFDTGKSVNYYTCTQISNMFEISTDQFFALNPEIKADCSNIMPLTTYCVDGFVEPHRATDGLCGPKHNNATCIGQDMQCCNAETFKCGNSTADCAPGTCYEGLCPGDKVYSTDGTCGVNHGNRLCAGKWGDCCNFNGKCGTGSAFCGIDSCQSGNCTRPATPSPSATGVPWLVGSTPDGTCGGAKKYTCNVVWGDCCNSAGMCGSLDVDCGTGCQSQFGKCSSASPTSTKKVA
ncbi:hypothetical protein PTMSG1_10019 [Pyrenophora teres f. maculata]|nr:hypothetical protein PTMSG1_10019 [Pyrenophora teres f. maculata]